MTTPAPDLETLLRAIGSGDLNQQLLQSANIWFAELLAHKQVERQHDALTGVTLRLLEGRLEGSLDSDERKTIIREAVADARYLLEQVRR